MNLARCVTIVDVVARVRDLLGGDTDGDVTVDRVRPHVEGRYEDLTDADLVRIADEVEAEIANIALTESAQ